MQFLQLKQLVHFAQATQSMHLTHRLHILQPPQSRQPIHEILGAKCCPDGALFALLACPVELIYQTEMFTTIIGKAGCGKTTQLAKLICDERRSTFVVLAATHSAVRNIYDACRRITAIKRTFFRTFHSFFRIDFRSGRMIGPLSTPSTIFIDEFSLIEPALFKRCFRSFNVPVRLVISGDPLQLNPITTLRYISFNKLNRIPPSARASINVVKHYANSIISSKMMSSARIVYLDTNYRSGQYVMSVIRAIYGPPDEPVDANCIRFVKKDELNGLLDDGYVFLASRYNILQPVYDNYYKYKYPDALTFRQKSIKKTLDYIHLVEGLPMVINMNDSHGKYHNGDEALLQRINWPSMLFNNGVETFSINGMDDSGVDLSPNNIVTIHKAQGRGYDKVIVCVDNLFDMSMLYTAITRARNDVVFYTAQTVNCDEALMGAAYREDYALLNEVIEKQCRG